MTDLTTFQRWDDLSWELSPKPGLPLLDRMTPEWCESLDPIESLALRYSSRAYLRPDQLPPTDPDWLYWLLIGARGTGKSRSGASWVIDQVLANRGGPHQEGVLINETDELVWSQQWSAMIDPAFFPPWVRYHTYESKGQIVFPDHDTLIHVHSAQKKQFRGFNLRFAWCDELTKWPANHARELLFNLQNSLRVPGDDPPRAVFTTNPPQQLDWIVELAMGAHTRTYRSRMRDNPMLDHRVVDAQYQAAAGTIRGRRELDGEIIVGGDGAMFRAEDLEQHRVVAPPDGCRVAVCVDPAQSGKRDADEVGVVVVGERARHLYVIASTIAQMTPAQWAAVALDYAQRFGARWLVVEPTGSGDYPRHTLATAMQLRGDTRWTIVESPARGPKSLRAGPVSELCAGGRLHIVGRQPVLEGQLTLWDPQTSTKSPGGIDALSHGAAWLTGAYQRVGTAAKAVSKRVNARAV